jgi:hypothetical protein
MRGSYLIAGQFRLFAFIFYFTRSLRLFSIYLCNTKGFHGYEQKIADLLRPSR